MSIDYKRLTEASASRVLDDYQSGNLDSTRLSSYTEGQFVEPVCEQRIRTTMLRCLELYEFYAEDKKHRSGEFDNAVGKLLHTEADISTTWARDPNFWIWLTFDDNVGTFIIDRRFLKDDTERGTAKKIHYALATLKDGYFAKCWLHADISKEIFGDYRMLDMHDVDFWDSHVVGIDYGFARNITGAFFQVIKDKKIERGDPSGPGIGYRQLSKELTRRNPTICYELMEFHTALSYVQNVWEHRSEWSIKHE